MSLLSELEKRLAENEERIGALIQHLETHTELEESLRDAGTGLSEANERVRQLAESGKITNQSLTEVLDAFREAVEILQLSDPSRAMKAVARVEKHLNKAEQRTIVTIGEAAEEISSRQEKVEQQLAAKVQLIQKSIPTTLIYITFVLVLALLGLEVLRYFPT